MHRIGAKSQPAPAGAGPPTARRARRASLALLGLVWLAFTYPMLGGKVHFPTDFGAYFFKVPANATQPSNLADTDAFNTLYPFRTYLGDQLLAGHLPLWDPTRFLGVPFAADPSTGTFYPPNWLYAFGSVPVVASVIWAATILASLLLAWWFLLVLRLHPYAAALGAIVFTFSGFMMAWATGDAVLGAAVWLPLALGGIEVARRGRRGRGVLLAGLALGLSALAGQPQVAYDVWLATGIWAAVAVVSAGLQAKRAAGAPQGIAVREVVRGAFVVAGAFGVGLGLASIQILGTLQYAGQLAPQPGGYATLLAYKVPAILLKTMLIPDYLGNPVNHNYLFASVYYTETALYAGVLTLPLAAAGLFHRHRRLSLGFGLLAFAGLAGVLGTPLLHLVALDLPLLGRFPGINLLALLVDAGLAGLATLGLDALLGRTERARRAATIGCAVLLCALALLTLAHWGTTVSVFYLFGRGLRAIVLLCVGWALIATVARSPRRAAAASAALAGLVGLDLWMFGFPYHVFQPDTPVVATAPELQYLALEPDPRSRFVQTDTEQLPPNFSMVFGLYSLNGFDALVPAGVLQLRSLMQPGLPAASQVADAILPLANRTTEPPVLDLLGVHSVTAPNTTVLGAGTLATNSTFSVFNEEGAFPAAFVVGCWSLADDGAALVRMQTMSGGDLQSTVLVAPGPDTGELGSPPASCAPGPTPAAAATTQRYDPQDVVVSVPDASPGGVLVLTDQWYPGWTATVDGRPAPILRADVALRGVAVGPGSHTVEFRYRPRWPLQGLAVVSMTLALVGVGATWRTRGPGRRVLSRR